MKLIHKEKNGKERIIHFLGLKFKYTKKMTEYDELDARKYYSNFPIEDKIKILKYQFKQNAKYDLNLENPQTFNEKMQWLKLYNEDLLINICADKYAVREYIKNMIGAEYLSELLGVWDKPEEIDFSSLPNQFVLKVNWGSGQNIIVRDKNKLDIPSTIKKLNKWLEPSSNHYFYSFEFSYKNIVPKIICEKYIGELDNNLTCYKFFNFNSEPYLIQAVYDDKTAKETINYYDLNWKQLKLRQNYPNNKNNPPKPKNLKKMIELSKKLSQAFPYFVRTDFFEINDKILFSEFTFFSDNGMAAFKPKEWDYKLGQLINLPPQAKLIK